MSSLHPSTDGHVLSPAPRLSRRRPPPPEWVSSSTVHVPHEASTPGVAAVVPPAPGLLKTSLLVENEARSSRATSSPRDGQAELPAPTLAAFMPLTHHLHAPRTRFGHVAGARHPSASDDAWEHRNAAGCRRCQDALRELPWCAREAAAEPTGRRSAPRPGAASALLLGSLLGRGRLSRI
ncbi:hypothetical protein FA09DRAFT_216973 [Tilletiopsis washingtonensis]|uniref:Uncharacterized protein n=1 Tax=Tilletiopsis washingtonensis TaxID=58919 RepID=A0A316ZFP4_9BASI|nr:hypothetical protein FA09DRAFT_216973 [Tilletiopsis washingtonensis]PWN99732.1 hypothetical protein FA09DRAFT_216973 [Tilletiopsis washingtonensis]